MEEILSPDMATLAVYLKTWRLKLGHIKTVTAAFHLHNREAKRELQVYANGKLLPFFPVPAYLGIKLDKALTFRHHLETLNKNLITRIMLLTRLAGSEWGAGAKTLRTASLSLVYSTAENCAPVSYRSAHTRLIDSALNDTLCIYTGYLRLRQRTTCQSFQASSQLSFAAWERHFPWPSVAPGPDHILHGQLAGLPDVPRERLKSRRPSVPAARKLLNDLSIPGIRGAQWKNYRSTYPARSHFQRALSRERRGKG